MSRGRVVDLFTATFFPDPARPVEWLSLLGLAGWAQFLAGDPEVLLRDSYTAFNFLPAWGWVLLMAGVVVVHLAAMVPVTRERATLRFVAMAIAAGLWTIVALSFWNGQAITTGARMYTAIAFLTAMTGVWLGWNRPQARK